MGGKTKSKFRFWRKKGKKKDEKLSNKSNYDEGIYPLMTKAPSSPPVSKQRPLHPELPSTPPSSSHYQITISPTKKQQIPTSQYGQEAMQKNYHKMYTPASKPTMASQSSQNYTPKTLPPTPSPSKLEHPSSGTKWQEHDEEMKIKSMARLQKLAQEHTKHVQKESIPVPLRSFDDNSIMEENQKQQTAPKEQKIIDAVLGINPCVPMETKEVIRDYASKPTSPATVINLDMLKQGSSKVFDFAKTGMGKLMNCASDLQQIHEDNACMQQYRKNMSHARRSQYDDYSSDEEGTFAGMSVRGGRESSPVSRLGGYSMDESDDESLGQVMQKLDLGTAEDGNANLGRGVTLVEDEIDERTPMQRVASSRRSAELNRKANKLGAEYLKPKASSTKSEASKVLDSTSKNSLSKETPSKYEIYTANPSTSNIPFDEHSAEMDGGNIYEPVI